MLCIVTEFLIVVCVWGGGDGHTHTTYFLINWNTKNVLLVISLTFKVQIPNSNWLHPKEKAWFTWLERQKKVGLICSPVGSKSPKRHQKSVFFHFWALFPSLLFSFTRTFVPCGSKMAASKSHLRRKSEPVGPAWVTWPSLSQSWNFWLARLWSGVLVSGGGVLRAHVRCESVSPWFCKRKPERTYWEKKA